MNQRSFFLIGQIPLLGVSIPHFGLCLTNMTPQKTETNWTNRSSNKLFGTTNLVNIGVVVIVIISTSSSPSPSPSHPWRPITSFQTSIWNSACKMGDAARAFISFLLCEAKQAEGRARSLRATAAMIEANNIEGETSIRVYRAFFRSRIYSNLTLLSC